MIYDITRWIAAFAGDLESAYVHVSKEPGIKYQKAAANQVDTCMYLYFLGRRSWHRSSDYP